MLTIPLERLGYIIEKAREFDEVPVDPDSGYGSDPADDERQILLGAPDKRGRPGPRPRPII